MAKRSTKRRRAASRSLELEASDAPRRRRGGSTTGRRCVIDIGSNSVRLVDLRRRHAQPDAAVQREDARRPRPRGPDQGPAAARRGGEGARRAQAVPCAVRHHAGQAVCGCWRPPPAATPENGPDFIAKAQRICRTQYRRDLRQARGGAHRAWRRFGLSSARRHRRRSRRRLARTGRCPGHPRQARRHAAARRPRPAGPLRNDRSRRPRRSSSRRCQSCRASRRARAAHSMRSAAPGVRSPNLHMAQTGYPLHVMHGYVIRAKEALEFSRLVRRVIRKRCRRSRSSPPPAVRCCPMRRWCSSTSCAGRRAARGGVLGARRARGPALFAAQRARAQARMR